METKVSRGKATYDWAKKNKYCVRCYQSLAMINSTMCPDCAEKNNDKMKLRYSKMTVEEKKARQEKQYQLYHRRLENGLCGECGKRAPKKGESRCTNCKNKNSISAQKRRGNPIPRHERPSYGECYFCANPVIPEMKVCEACYDRINKMVISRELNPTEAMIKQREERRKFTEHCYRR